MNNIILLPTKLRNTAMTPQQHDAIAGVALMELRLNYLKYIGGNITIESYALDQCINEDMATQHLIAGRELNETMLYETHERNG